jgi:hypothetical protein
MTKRVMCTFELDFTTDDTDKLPEPSQLERFLEEKFSEIIDSYVFDKDIEPNEMHLILADNLTIEEHD